MSHDMTHQIFRRSHQRRVASVALIALAWTMAAGCGPCGNELLDRYAAPDNSLEVVVFQRSCGATTGFSTQASILAAGAELGNSGGNIVVATTDHGAAPAGKGGGPEVRVRWLDSTTVEIAHHRKASIGDARRSYKGVAIRYVTFEAP